MEVEAPTIIIEEEEPASFTWIIALVLPLSCCVALGILARRNSKVREKVRRITQIVQRRFSRVKIDQDNHQAVGQMSIVSEPDSNRVFEFDLSAGKGGRQVRAATVLRPKTGDPMGSFGELVAQDQLSINNAYQSRSNTLGGKKLKYAGQVVDCENGG